MSADTTVVDTLDVMLALLAWLGDRTRVSRMPFPRFRF
jgi:hypothetical protein